MKKIPFLAIITAFLFTGCADATDLGNRAIIQAAAIDYDDGYRVSALLFSSGGAGSDVIDASQENVIKVVGTGKTLAEAVDNLSLVDGKKIYMSETKLLVLGDGFSEESVSDALNTLYYDLRCSLNMPVCCAENAEFLTDLQFTEGITSAEKPLSMIENAHELGFSPKTTLLDLFADASAKRTSLIPMFKPSENGRGMTSAEDGETAVLSGCRVLENGFLTSTFDQRQTVSLLLKGNKTDHIALNYVFRGEEKTCEAYAIKVLDEVDDFGHSWTVQAKFRSRTGGKIPDDERETALQALVQAVRGVDY